MELMKEKGVISFLVIAIISIIVIGAAAGGYYFFIRDSGGNDSNKNANESTVNLYDEENVTPGEPYLVLNITDYPKTITNMCQDVKIVFEAQNLGDVALRYSDLADKYAFQIKSDDAMSSLGDGIPETVIDTTAEPDDYGLLNYQTLISDFGEIQPGDKSTITFSAINYTIYDKHEYFYMNSFSQVANGNYSYYVSFEELPEEGGIFPNEITRSKAVEISTSIMDDNGGSKYCEYELITDDTIDFYK